MGSTMLNTSHDIELTMTPDGVNPYVVNGRNLVPDVLWRVMDTPDALSGAIRQVMRYRNMAALEVASRAGLASSEADEVIERGTGTISSVMAVLNALGIKPVTLPGPRYIRATTN